MKVVASGGVVFRRGSDGKLKVIIGWQPPGGWRLPKGTPEPGEPSIETAIREVREETGLEVELDGVVGDTAYSFVRSEDGARYEKTVTFYLMWATGGDTSRHDPEFETVEWFDPQEAAKRLTYSNEARILEAAIAVVTNETASGA